jgi:preprotein translocase subunit SecG
VEILLILVHVFVCIVLIFVVLLQSGKAADLAGAFGGGGSQTALGSRGAVTVLAKATTVCAILFMLTSLGLALLGSRGTSSVLDTAKLPAAAPAAPATPPADGGTVPAAAPPTEGPAPAPNQAAPVAGQTAPAAGQSAPAGTAPAGNAAPVKPPAGPKPGGGR